MKKQVIIIFYAGQHHPLSLQASARWLRFGCTIKNPDIIGYYIRTIPND